MPEPPPPISVLPSVGAPIMTLWSDPHMHLSLE
jgi:hypothetical protein